MDARQSAATGPLVRRYDYDDRTVIAADFGTAEVAVDVVDGTAILVAGDGETEIDLPEGEATAFNRNGVVTIEVRG